MGDHTTATRHQVQAFGCIFLKVQLISMTALERSCLTCSGVSGGQDIDDGRGRDCFGARLRRGMQRSDKEGPM
jgi:hypothetical protein